MIIYIVAALVAIVSLPLFIDNRDQSIWQESTKDSTVFAQAQHRILTEETQQMLKTELVAQEERHKQEFKTLFQNTENVCLNGKNPKGMSYEQRTTEFINGPCAPVVLVPGLAGTSLQVLIDCEKLQSESPQIFKSCGWDTCNPWYVWYSRPSEEYRLWISTTTSKMGMISKSDKEHCFGDLIELHYDERIQRHVETPGLRMTYNGNTKATKKDCGLTGIRDLTDDYVIKMMMCDYKGYQSISELLDNMGYISGLLYQAMPYDYRKSLAVSESQPLLKQTIDNLYAITGKKTIILTHSLGSLHTLNFLNHQTQEYKDSKVSTVLTMAPPYLGSSKAIRAHMGGDPGFLDTFLGMTVGINYYNQNMAINSASSQTDIYPKDTFIRFKDEPWMKEIMLRIQQEAQYLQTGVDGVTAINWFPSPSHKCSNITGRPEQCLMNMQDLSEPFITISGVSYNVSQIDYLLDHFTVNGTKISQFYHNNQQNNLNNLEHPGVPFIVLFGGFNDTDYHFNYTLNPKEVVSSGQFYFPNQTTTALGDQTVLISSAVTPAIKWIYEHQHNLSKYPVKLVEYCSNYKNNNTSIYDVVDGDGQRSMKNSGYHGLECECMKEGSAITNCKHACLINDKIIAEFVADLIQNNIKSIYNKSSMSNAQLQDIVDNCLNIKQDMITI